VNFRFLASAVWTTAEAVAQLNKTIVAEHLSR